MTSEFAGREPTNESTNESRDSTFAKVSRDTTVVRGNVGAWKCTEFPRSILSRERCSGCISSNPRLFSFARLLGTEWHGNVTPGISSMNETIDDRLND